LGDNWVSWRIGELETWGDCFGSKAELFATQRLAITKHLKNIFDSGELIKESTYSILEHMGNNKRIYKIKYYNLDAILSVGV
jgi:hypothetical protein